MNQDAHQKVKATHLKRNAYLYVIDLRMPEKLND